VAQWKHIQDLDGEILKERGIHQHRFEDIIKVKFRN